MNVSNGTGDQVALVKDGNLRPFVRFLRNGEILTVTTKFKVRPVRHFLDATA